MRDLQLRNDGTDRRGRSASHLSKRIGPTVDAFEYRMKEKTRALPVFLSL
jgi:hypothetical protein